MKEKIDKFFQITKRNSTIKTELIGGVTTFLTMSYIVFTNPAILSEAGMDFNALITVTILATIIGTLIFAFNANAPFVLSSGMGLNAFFTYSLVIGNGIPWQVGLGVVFISGLVFFLLSLFGIRQYVASAIPEVLKNASAAGIGLFLAFVGLQGMEVITDNASTLVQLGEFNSHSILSLFSLTLMCLLFVHNVRGGIIISIILSTILAIIFGLVDLPSSIVATPPSIMPVAFKLDILGALKLSLVGAMFSFLFIDMFDSLSFLMACSEKLGFKDKDGNIENLNKMMVSDSSSTMIGAVLGTSTVTSLSDSAAGISAGARTGLSSVFVAMCFALLLFFTPLIALVPKYVVSPALVIVGIFMISSANLIDFEKPRDIVPAFLTMVLMPLTYSIAIGLSFGFISYILIKLFDKKFDEIPITLYIIGGLCLINLILS